MVAAPGNEPNCVVVLGPTAAGKTALAVHLARLTGGEILSADSRQVYRGLDIGSGKDLSEYGEIPFHLIDLASLPDEYNLFSYQRDAYRAFSDIVARGKLPVIVGGTGMYIDAIVRGYLLREVPENSVLRRELAALSMDALADRLRLAKGELHNRTDLGERDRLVRAIEIAEYRRECGTFGCDGGTLPGQAGNSGATGAEGGLPERPAIRPLILGLRFPRAVLRERIRQRLYARIEEGLVEEVRSIHESGISWDRIERLGLEYRFTAEYLQGKSGGEESYAEGLYRAICRFAKRQETWFRGMERKGVDITWIDGGDRFAAEAMVLKAFGGKEQAAKTGPAAR